MSNQNFPRGIVVDANFLVAIVSPKTSNDDQARIDYLFENAERAKSKIIIPMPAVAEYLVGADIAALETFNKLEKKAFVWVAPFDRAAAFECAQLDRAAIGSGDKKDGIQAPWQKIKIDRQIVATAKAYGATLIISGDESIRNNALRVGISAKTIQELELPLRARQIPIAYEVPKS